MENIRVNSLRYFRNMKNFQTSTYWITHNGYSYCGVCINDCMK